MFTEGEMSAVSVMKRAISNQQLATSHHPVCTRFAEDDDAHDVDNDNHDNRGDDHSYYLLLNMR